MARRRSFRSRIAGPGRVIDALAAERFDAEERIEAARAARARKVEARWLTDDTLAVRIARGYDWCASEYLIDYDSYSAGRLARLVGDEHGNPMFREGGVSMPKRAQAQAVQA